MRMLGSGHSGRLLTALRMECRRDERSQVHFHECHGLRLPCVPVLRHNHLPRTADCGFLRSYISSNRETGQSHEREILMARRPYKNLILHR